MTPQERLEAAMARALDRLDEAQADGQPGHILDRLEAAYFSALDAYERVMRGRAA